MSKFDVGILGRLADLTPDEITAALAAIRAEGTSFAGQTPTAEVVARTSELAEAARALKAEESRRAEAAKAYTDNLSSLNELTEPAPAEKPAESAPAQAAPAETSPSESLADKADDKAEDKPDADAPKGDESGEDTVTAAARRRIGSNNTGAPAKAARTLPQVAFRTTAAVGLREAQPGEQIDRAQLYSAFGTRIKSVMGSKFAGPRPERYEVATVRADFPEERTLTRADSSLVVMDKIQAAVNTARGIHAQDNAQALVAAGLCAPLENLYDIEVIGDDDRPVRDALVRFGADRGGIQYRPSIDGVAQTGGIGVWTAANDEADPLVPKVCAEIDCPDLITATVDAIYQCLTFSNMSTRFDPEWMDSIIRSQRVAHARFAENRLLTQLVTGSKTVYSTQLLGAVRDALWTLDHMIAYFRNVHRLRNDVPLRMIAPLWLLNMLRADITYQMVGDGLQSLAITDAEIASWFAVRNVNITWHLDGIDPADITTPDPDIVVPAQFYTTLTTGSPVPGFPDAVSTLLFREGDWLHLDGGTLDLGTVRDSTLNGENRFQTFAESWEGLAFRGIESFQLVLRLNPTGASAATVSTASAS
jgi:hypothetical protein